CHTGTFYSICGYTGASGSAPCWTDRGNGDFWINYGDISLLPWSLRRNCAGFLIYIFSILVYYWNFGSDYLYCFTTYLAVNLFVLTSTKNLSKPFSILISLKRQD